MEEVVDIYPVKSDDVFTTIALMPVGEGDDVATKFLHFTLYVKLVLIRSF